MDLIIIIIIGYEVVVIGIEEKRVKKIEWDFKWVSLNVLSK